MQHLYPSSSVGDGDEREEKPGCISFLPFLFILNSSPSSDCTRLQDRLLLVWEHCSTLYPTLKQEYSIVVLRSYCESDQVEREEIVKITEEGGRRESGDGGEGSASWGLMMMSSTGLGGCCSAVRNRAISSKQRFLYPVWAVAVENWDHVARLIPMSPFL